MSSPVPIECFDGIDKFSQKCLVPFHLFKKSSLRLNEFVTLKTSNNTYISRVFINMQPLTSIFVDGSVSCRNSIEDKPNESKEFLFYPENLCPIQISVFDKMFVEIILKEDCVVRLSKIECEGLVHKILSRFTLMKNCVIDCEGLKIADQFNIKSILVYDALPAECKFGKVTRFTAVDLVDLTSTKTINLKKTLQCLQLGGMEHIMTILKFNLLKSYKSHGVIVTGPTGSGKSLLVKKFCNDLNCFVVMIDAQQDPNLTSEHCSAYIEQILCYMNIFPKRTCLFIIDHLDAITSFESKQNISVVSLLVSLIHSLKDLGVYVLATATNRKNLDHKIASLFCKEVNVGIPSLLQRREIIAALLQNSNCEVDCDKVARMTPGFVGRDIALLLEEARKINQTQGFSTVDNIVCLTDEDIGNALSVITPSVLKTSLWNIKVKPVYWNDIGGMFHVKKRLQMCIEWPLHNPEVFKKVDLPCPHGVLLFGPPGCCKTTLARGLATECNANFFAANPAQIYSPYVGESEKNIIELFYQARLCAPSIIFLDELDSLVSQRKLDKKSQGVGEKVLSTLLNEMDGFGTKVQFQTNVNMQKLLNREENMECKEDTAYGNPHSSDDVIVVAATNRPDLIDDALLRPGRFDIILYVPPPNLEERKSILQTLTATVPMRDVDLVKVAEKTDLFSGADLKNLCNEAALNALRHDITASLVTETNFEEALRKVKPSITKQQLEMYEKLSIKYGTVIKRF